MFRKYTVFNKTQKLDRNKIVFVLSVGTIGALLSVSQLIFSLLKARLQQPTIATIPVGEDVERWIAPEIQGHEREVMRGIIRSHPLDQRENVTYIDANGKVYGNNAQSKSVQVGKPVGNGLYTYDGVENFPLSTYDNLK
jgi:hypothetical protein